MAHGSASNFIRQTVGSSVGTNDPETIDVTDASAFPDPSTSQYDIVIWDAGSFNRPDQDSDVEVLTVTARDTGNNTLTCTRGQQGTSNTSHPSTSDVIIAPLSVGDFNTVRTHSVSTTQFEYPNIRWEEDDNSPFTISDSNSAQFTLSGEYDLVIMRLLSGSSASFLTMQVNGDTGNNYDWVDNADMETSGASAVENIVPPGNASGTEYVMSGRWGNSWGLSVTPVTSGTGFAVGGINNTVTSPLNTITLADDGAAQFSATFVVLGGTEI